MKGTFFQKPLEFNIQVEGESWSQGDAVAVSVQIKNHGSVPVDLAAVGIHLAYGSLKKVHEKVPEAFDLLASSPVMTAVLAPNQATSVSHTFFTHRNCPITDNSKSLFLVYGQGTEHEKLGFLQLNFRPFPVINDFLNIFQTNFRFARKSQKSTKAGLDVKLVPPDSKAFAALESLSLTFRFDNESIEIQYSFNTKTVEATAASVEAKKKKKEFSRVFTPEEYLRPSGRFDHERMEPAIREDLARAELGIL